MAINNTMDIRKQNIEIVRKALLKSNGMTKNELCLATELSLASCTNILKILMDSGEIRDVVDCESTGGRRAKRFYINEKHELVLTILISVLLNNKVAIEYRVVDLSGKIVRAFSNQTEGLLEETITIKINEIMKEYPNVKAVGVSIAGVVKDDHAINSNEFVFEVGDIKNIITKQYHIPVIVENDLNLAVLGFAMSLGIQNQNIVLIDRGLGAGLYIDNKVVKGFSGFAGEIGYMPIDGKLAILNHGSEEHYRALGRMCANYVAIVNPGIIGINDVAKDNIEIVISELEKYIPREHCPKIVYTNRKEEFIMQGIIEVTLNSIR